MQDELREEKPKHTTAELDKQHKGLMAISDLIVEQSSRLAVLERTIDTLLCSKYQPLEVQDLIKEKNLLQKEYEKNCETQEKLTEEFFAHYQPLELKK